MSGFEYTVACRACGLTSRGFPFVYDSVVAPTQIVLPVANTITQQFERLTVATDRQLDADELDRLAASGSRPGFTVCVPCYDERYVQVLRPSVACPRCASTAVELETPRSADVLCTHIDEIVEASGRRRQGVTTTYRLAALGVRVSVLRERDVCRWSVTRDGASDIASVVEALIEALTRQGSEIVGVRRFRGFTRFDERLNKRSGIG